MIPQRLKEIPWLGHDLAIDLGSTHTVVWARGKGIVLDEPSLVVCDDVNGHIQAIGQNALLVLGREPERTKVFYPLKGGVITDARLAQIMLRYIVQRSQTRRFLLAPRVLLTVPTGATSVERAAVREAGEASGARSVFLIEQAMAAAMGVGLPVSETTGSMVVLVGAGRTEIAIISYGGIVVSSSVEQAGQHITDTIVQCIREHYGVVVGEVSAEKMKKTRNMNIQGRDVSSGLPRSIVVDPAFIDAAVEPVLEAILKGVLDVLGQCPPELAGDLSREGLVLTGGSARGFGLSQRLAQATGLSVKIPQDPAASVVVGAGRCIEQLSAFHIVLGARKESW